MTATIIPMTGVAKPEVKSKRLTVTVLCADCDWADETDGRPEPLIDGHRDDTGHRRYWTFELRRREWTFPAPAQDLPGSGPVERGPVAAAPGAPTGPGQHDLSRAEALRPAIELPPVGGGTGQPDLHGAAPARPDPTFATGPRGPVQPGDTTPDLPRFARGVQEGPAGPSVSVPRASEPGQPDITDLPRPGATSGVRDLPESPPGPGQPRTSQEDTHAEAATNPLPAIHADTPDPRRLDQQAPGVQARLPASAAWARARQRWQRRAGDHPYPPRFPGPQEVVGTGLPAGRVGQVGPAGDRVDGDAAGWCESCDAPAVLCQQCQCHELGHVLRAVDGAERAPSLVRPPQLVGGGAGGAGDDRGTTRPAGGHGRHERPPAEDRDRGDDVVTGRHAGGESDPAHFGAGPGQFWDAPSPRPPWWRRALGWPARLVAWLLWWLLRDRDDDPPPGGGAYAADTLDVLTAEHARQSAGPTGWLPATLPPLPNLGVNWQPREVGAGRPGFWAPRQPRTGAA